MKERKRRSSGHNGGRKGWGAAKPLAVHLLNNDRKLCPNQSTPYILHATNNLKDVTCKHCLKILKKSKLIGEVKC